MKFLDWNRRLSFTSGFKTVVLRPDTVHLIAFAAVSGSEAIEVTLLGLYRFDQLGF
jgi:hypothetical protein